MFKKIFFILCTVAVFYGANLDKVNNFGKVSPVFTDISDNHLWAKDAIYTLVEIGAVSGLSENTFSPDKLISKEELAKMLYFTFKPVSDKENTQIYSDVLPTRWSSEYISSFGEFFPKKSGSPDTFNPEGAVTREDLAFICAKILNLEASVDDTDSQYPDFSTVSEENKGFFLSAVKNGLITGSDGYIYPQKEVTRAEACVIIKRAEEIKNDTKKNDSLSKKIIGKSEITLSQATKWAKTKNADERFLNVAPLYWEYGEKTGIRPEVLYAQAAKETNFGKYTGNVVPEQNNWAGIKTVAASSDATFDHESFETPEDGVRGHFNHMCAYVGLAPVGTPHERFAKTVTASWAGSIVYIEDLGGKWAPASDYGKSIYDDYLIPMSKT